MLLRTFAAVTGHGLRHRLQWRRRCWVLEMMVLMMMADPGSEKDAGGGGMPAAVGCRRRWDAGGGGMPAAGMPLKGVSLSSCFSN
ncbi:hypothetical protein Hdeb2414_s0002g00064881 [Helianthus debilis subsp. tardiflorus]